MGRKAKPVDLDKLLFCNGIIADAVEYLIEDEISSNSYNRKSSESKRRRELNDQYTNLFSQKDLSFFEFTQIDQMLQSCTAKERLRVFRLVIYLLKEKIISDIKLERLIVFEHRFTTQGASYTDFVYLMNSEIYSDFVYHQEDLTKSEASDLFFAHVSFDLYDDEIATITQEWCEKMKINFKYTILVRRSKIFMIFSFVKKFFVNAGIDVLTLEDLKDEDITVLEYLHFMDARHKLSKDIRYLLTFQDMFKGRGALKLKEMCCAQNIFQYVRIKAPDNDRYIYKLDIPEGTMLFKDMVGFASQFFYSGSAFRKFVENFYKSMGSAAVNITTNLSLDTLRTSASWFWKSTHETSCATYLFSFYNYCYDRYRVNFFEKDGIDIAVIFKQGLIQRMNKGFAITKYNRLDPVPVDDKWILCYEPQYDAATEQPTSKTIVMDFTDILNTTFRQWVKAYVWYVDKALHAKRIVANIVKKGLNYIHQIRTKEIVVIYCREVSEIDGPLTANEIMAVREFYRNQEGSDVTIHSNIYNFRAFLQFLDDYNIIKVESSLYYHLYHQNEPRNTSKALPEEDLNKLTKVVVRNMNESISNALFAVVYAIALDTSFRISQILSLQYDCVIETAKHKEYVIVSRDKDMTTDMVQEPITRETKRMIDRVIDITEEYRNHAPENLKSKLFIVPYSGSVSYRILNRNNFSIYLKECCHQAGIENYTAANLRDTHMTMAKMHQLKLRLSDLELSVLTGHATPNVDIEHYIDMDVTTMMEALHGVIIGNIDITGRVMAKVPENISIVANEVSNGCGYCQKEYCNNLTYLDCILCKDFVTMPSRLPFFEEQIRLMDIKIKNAEIPHDKEDFVNIKRLLVAYESALKSIEVKK